MTTINTCYCEDSYPPSYITEYKVTEERKQELDEKYKAILHHYKNDGAGLHFHLGVYGMGIALFPIDRYHNDSAIDQVFEDIAKETYKKLRTEFQQQNDNDKFYSNRRQLLESPSRHEDYESL